MPYTILHLSDLHRADDDPISNEELLSALLADRDRAVAEDPQLGDPAAIVVSGDLVQGARLGDPEYESTLNGQYEVATDFLRRLADEFLAGDRSRLVLVPGNHDVDWNTAFAAMRPVPDAEVPSNFSDAMCGPTADLRWSWSERRAYTIVDRNRYEQRLAGFNSLITRFYESAPAVVQTPDYRLHELLDDRIGVVAFDSCVGNDCFARHGAIRHDAIARAHIHLRGGGHELLIAVWHHNIDGEPATTDYMAVSAVHRMIGIGFRMGLHGHQHRAATALRYVHLPAEEQMAVISAGSLCAGRRELPKGVNRQYNVIEIADDLLGARVHVREMAIATNFAAARRAEFGGNSWMDVQWTLPIASTRAAEMRRNNIVIRAESKLVSGDPEAALIALRELGGDDVGYARAIRLAALRRLDRWQGIVDGFSPPRNLDELAALSTALAELGEPDRALSVLETEGRALGLPEPSMRDLTAAVRAIGSLR